MKRYYCVAKDDVNNVIDKINKVQAKSNWFVNISVKPYKGKKKFEYVVIVG